jgi:acetyl esterase
MRSHALATVVVLFGFLAGMASAAAPECLPLTPRNPDGNYLVAGVRGNIVYRRVETRAKGESREIALDAYRQPGDGVHPAVIVVHGGGVAGSRVTFVGQLLETLTAAGYSWVSIDYRLGSLVDRSEAVDDVMAALAFVRCHAAALGIEPTRIALLGEDSGADLVADAARRDPSIRALVLAGGTFAHGVAVKTVRSLVIHGGADSDVPLSRAEAWCGTRATVARCDLVVTPGASHRVENWLPAQWTYKTRLVDWLHAALGAGALVEMPKRITFESRDDSLTIGPGLVKNIVYDGATELALDAWLPRGPGRTAAIVLVHGGGWEAGDKVTYITPLFETLARAGYAWFSIDYRLTPAVKHPAQMDDLRSALAFIRRHADRLRVDPRRVVVVGESASGQMAALLATEDYQLAGVVSFYGVYDFMAFATPRLTPRSLPARLFGLSSIDSNGEGLLRRYSPINHVRREMPPILLVHGTGEELWTQGQSMARALTTAGARHELYALEGAPHGMENWEGRPEWQPYKQKVVDFIQRVTRAP